MPPLSFHVLVNCTIDIVGRAMWYASFGVQHAAYMSMRVVKTCADIDRMALFTLQALASMLVARYDSILILVSRMYYTFCPAFLSASSIASNPACSAFRSASAFSNDSSGCFLLPAALLFCMLARPFFCLINSHED